MILIIVSFLYLIITGLSIYIFNYLIDIQVNGVAIVFGSILIGLLLTAMLLWIVLKAFNLLLPKEKIQTSIFKHKILKQIISVPIHFSLIRVKVIGKEHLPKNTGFTLYSNHNNWMDPIIIAYGLYNHPVGALGKEGAFNIPVVGNLGPKFGNVMIHRQDLRQSAEAIKKTIKHVEKGLAMIIFPEGTRSPNTSKLLDFKAGAFKVALRSKKPLVPITLIKHKKKRIFSKVTIHIHKSLEYTDFKHLKSKELSESVKQIIEDAL